MEDLNKSQLILLALLVSFVTSIATGIVTVSMMNETPTTVTQTINRIVERTVEKVVPGETQTVIKEVPIIVTEEDLLVKVINKSKPALVKIYTKDGSGFVGTGFLVRDELTVATTLNIFPADSSGETFKVSLSNGLSGEALLSGKDDKTKLAILKIKKDTLVTGEKKVFSAESAPELSAVSVLEFSTTTPSVGQTALALGASDADSGSVSAGIIASADNDSQVGGVVIRTNAISAASIGGPLLNIEGKVVGVNTNTSRAIGSGLLKSLVDQN